MVPAHAGEDVPELALAVGGLVLVHEVHVDGVVGDLLVELCSEVAERLAVLAQAHRLGKQHELLAVIAELLLFDGVFSRYERRVNRRVGGEHVLAHVDGGSVIARAEQLEMQPRFLVDARNLGGERVELLLFDRLAGEGAA